MAGSLFDSYIIVSQFQNNRWRSVFDTKLIRRAAFSYSACGALKFPLPGSKCNVAAALRCARYPAASSAAGQMAARSNLLNTARRML